MGRYIFAICVPFQALGAMMVGCVQAILLHADEVIE
jgi:hypothetical protein